MKMEPLLQNAPTQIQQEYAEAHRYLVPSSHPTNSWMCSLG